MRISEQIAGIAERSSFGIGACSQAGQTEVIKRAILAGIEAYNERLKWHASEAMIDAAMHQLDVCRFIPDREGMPAFLRAMAMVALCELKAEMIGGEKS